MTLLMICFVIAVGIVLLGAEDETLEDMRERQWVNRMADESKRKKQGRRHKYSRAGL